MTEMSDLCYYENLDFMVFPWASNSEQEAMYTGVWDAAHS